MRCARYVSRWEGEWRSGPDGQVGLAHERARERRRKRGGRERESKVAQILNQAQAEGVGFSRRGAHGSEADREVVGVGVALR